MSALSHIGRSIAKKQITAIVRAGEAQRLMSNFAERPGVLSVSHHHARGVGSQRIRKGQLYFNEKDVLVLLVEAEYSDAIFSAIFHEGSLGEEGNGMIFIEPVMRGHPMMPFEGADW